MTVATPVTAKEFCDRLGVALPAGTEPGRVIEGVTTLDAAGPGHASFFARPKLRPAARKSNAALILTTEAMDFDDPRAVRSPNVMATLIAALRIFHPVPVSNGRIDATARIAETVQIGDNVQIGPYTIIEDGAEIGGNTIVGPLCVIGPGSKVGSNALLHPRVTIAHQCTVGNRVELHSGVVIGADGFRYEPTERGATKVPQVGTVVIEDDVEVGANTTIDRASFDATRIGARTKIDNLVHIGHNVDVGTDCIIVGQVGISGSVKVGRGVMIGGQAGFKDNIEIGDGAMIAARAGVSRNIPPGMQAAGAPAIDAKTFFKAAAIFNRLPEIYPQIRPYLTAIDESEEL